MIQNHIKDYRTRNMADS